MGDDFASLELFFAQQDSHQGRFARPISTDKTDLHIIHQGDISPLEDDLIAESLVSITELEQYSHVQKK
ncbi:hypothetical protein GCM10023156_15510 [Novipirellula rosea]|uniref:Uncharacterized protein n=1 Tax=Novipirellula rosea TaxID=1031540 RepID=A0ABP8MGD7_9BACT